MLPVLKRAYGHPKQSRKTRLGQPSLLADFGDRRHVRYTTRLAELEFTDDALRALAQKALKRDTGARALRSITEELMVDLMYQLPEESKPAKYVINRDIVERKADLLTAKQNTKKESA